MNDYSMKEVQSLVFKAARGAGMSWGLAEETSSATIWLLRNNLSVLESLTNLLLRHHLNDYADLRPEITEFPNLTNSTGLCPIICGTYIADMARSIDIKKHHNTGEVFLPLFLLPHIATVCAKQKCSAHITWGSFEAYLDAKHVHIARSEDEFFAPSTEQTTIHYLPSPEIELSSRIHRQRVQITANTYNMLALFAHETYVPETEESRLSGAGGGSVNED